MRKGFTLIELLVVVGIIAILAIAALIAINPLEAQRRSRDSARLQDMARLSGVIEAFINDNGSTGLTTGNVTSGATVARSQPCQNNWISATADFCSYIKQIPLDPQNGRTINALTGAGTAANPTRADVNSGYGFFWSPSTGDYQYCTRLEADKNFEILANDGGGAGELAIFQTGTNMALACAIP